MRVSRSTFCLLFFLALSLSVHAKPKKGQKDTVNTTFNSIPITLDADVKRESLVQDLASLSTGQEIIWVAQEQPSGPNNPPSSALYTIANLVLGKTSGMGACAAVPRKDTAYVIHVNTWKSMSQAGVSPAQLESSTWYVYHYPRFAKNKYLIPAPTSGSGDPFIYGAKNAVILSLDYFDNPSDSGTLQSSYAITVTQGTPQNITDLSTLISALTGTATQMGDTGFVAQSLFAAATCQKGTPQLPFDLQITQSVSAAKNTAVAGSSSTSMAAGGMVGQSGNRNTKTPGQAAPQSPSTGTVVCNGAENTLPCSMTRTFTSTDKEYWDVSGGVAIPGLKETSYTFSSQSGMTSTSVTRHTEIYAFADLFPFAALAPKDSWVPHINAGVPVTSKSLYRPYAGISENITGWTGLQKALKLPTAINVFAGMSYMKTEVINGPLPTSQATFNSALGHRRVWKPMFGIEIPISSIASKIGGKGGSSAAKGKN